MPAVTHWKLHTGTMWQFRGNNIAIIPYHTWEKNVFIRSVLLLSLFHQEALFIKYKHGESLLIGFSTHAYGVVHMAAKHRCGQGKALFSGLDVAASWKSNGWCLFAQGLNHFLPLETWNDDLASHPTICLNCVDRNVICVKRKLPSRRHGCPCLYYANSDATFHLKLIGDLVLKLNPGPLSRSIPTVVSRHESFRNNKCIWRRNPRNLISVQPNRLQSSL